MINVKNIKQDLSDKFVELRKIGGVTQQELANILGITHSRYSQIEEPPIIRGNGKIYNSFPSIEQFIKISNYFKTSLDEFNKQITNTPYKYINVYKINNQTIIKNLKKLRLKNNYTEIYIARNELNLKLKSYQKLENGEVDYIKLKYIIHLAILYNVSIYNILI